MADRIWSGVMTERGFQPAPHERQAFAAHRAKFAGQPVEVIIRKPKRQRSGRQNRYYWGVVLATIAAEAGYRRSEIDQLHDALAHKFLALQPDPLTGSPRRQRTPACDTHDFAVYLDQVIQLAAEHGWVIPPPDAVEPPEVDWPEPATYDRQHGIGVAA